MVDGSNRQNQLTIQRFNYLTKSD